MLPSASGRRRAALVAVIATPMRSKTPGGNIPLRREALRQVQAEHAALQDVLYSRRAARAPDAIGSLTTRIAGCPPWLWLWLWLWLWPWLRLRLRRWLLLQL